MFEVGDKVIRTGPDVFASTSDSIPVLQGEEYEVSGVYHLHIALKGVVGSFLKTSFKLTQERHVHHDAIIAWAKGKPIQWREGTIGGWKDCTEHPMWNLHHEYREKPQELIDIDKQIKELTKKREELLK